MDQLFTIHREPLSLKKLLFFFLFFFFFNWNFYEGIGDSHAVVRKLLLKL